METEVWLLPVEMGSFHGVTRKIFHRPTYERIRLSGRVYWRTWNKHKALPWIQLHPAVKEVQPCLHQAQKQSYCPDTLPPWFSPCLCPHPASFVCIPACAPACTVPRPLWPAAGPWWLLGPHGCYGKKTYEQSGPVYIREKEREQAEGERERERERELFVKLGLQYLRLGKCQAPFQTNQPIY